MPTNRLPTKRLLETIAYLSVPRVDLCPKSLPTWHFGPGFQPEAHAFDSCSAPVWENESPAEQEHVHLKTDILKYHLNRHKTHTTQLATYPILFEVFSSLT